MNEVLKPFELDKCPASRLPEEIQLFMKAIVSVCSYGNAFRSCLPLPLPLFHFLAVRCDTWKAPLVMIG